MQINVCVSEENTFLVENLLDLAHLLRHTLGSGSRVHHLHVFVGHLEVLVGKGHRPLLGLLPRRPLSLDAGGLYSKISKVILQLVNKMNNQSKLSVHVP